MTPITAPAAAAPEQDQAHARRWLTLSILCLSLLVIVVDSTIVNVALPTLARELHAGSAALEWIVDAYTLAFAALLLLAGSLGDRYGRHRALAAGLLVFGAGSLGAALASTAAELVVMRTVMGVGAAFIMPATMATIVAVFPDPAERAKAVGIWAAVSGLGVAIGPTAGGWLLQHFSWGSIFATNLPVIAIALVAGRFLVPPSAAPHRPRLDPAGALLATAGFGALTYTLIEAGTGGWTSGPTMTRAAVSAVLLAAFAGWEIRSSHPMIDFSLFRHARFTAASMAVMVVFFGLAGGNFVLVQILQFVLGYSPLGAGVRALPGALALTVAAPAGTRLASRFGAKVAVAAGLATMAAGLAFFATATGGSGYGHYLVASVIISAGVGLTMAPATNSIMGALPPAKAGIASAMNNTTRNVGAVLGVAIIGSVTASAYTHAMGSTSATPAAAHSVGAAAAIARTISGHAGQALQAAADNAFVHGAGFGALIAAAAAAAAAGMTLRYLPRH